MKIAVVGGGIAGLSAAWLLSQKHDVTLIEREERLGGHANTVDVETGGSHLAVDTGFIVYNEAAYPNLAALFAHLGVITAPTRMTFAVSLGDGAYEYSGSGLHRIFGQWRNLASLSQWRLAADIVQFFRHASAQAAGLPAGATLGDLLARHGYSAAFVDRHLLPMAGAIWSVAPGRMSGYPAAAFIQFFENHGLLKLTNRPCWRTVVGGSREYVSRLAASGCFRTVSGVTVTSVRRSHGAVSVSDGAYTGRFDHAVIATHADEALAMLDDADEFEVQDLGAFAYSRNRAILHTDATLMPQRRKLWSSWNYLGREGMDQNVATVTYWMNSLQPLNTSANLFVTLNPRHEPAPGTVLREFSYDHPVFDSGAMAAQQRIWRLQGRRRTWFCGAHFGAGFHEDGLQSGLAVAEQLGGLVRPWKVANPSGRIHVTSAPDFNSEYVREAAE